MAVDFRPRLWRVVGIAIAAIAARAGMPAAESGARPLWIGLFALFVVLWWALNGPHCLNWSSRARTVAVAAAGAAGLALVALGHGAFTAVFPVLVAALAGSLLAERAAWTLVAAQGLLVAPALLASGYRYGEAALLALLFGGLQLFVGYAALLARSEGAARGRLETAHRELELAQAGLAAASRDGERLRIARELHDVAGHHLTALSLALEAATHAGGEARERAIDEAQILTKRLLRELRQVVSALREASLDGEAELRSLAGGTGRPRVHLSGGEAIAGLDGDRARTIVRFAQEAITNAARHGGAENLWLEIRQSGGELVLAARDDGRAGPEPQAAVLPGHGLAGIDERARGLGGRASWARLPGGGFELRLRLPRAQATETAP